MAHDIINNTDKKRFEIHLNGKIAQLDYMIAGTNIVYTHTEVPQEMEGQGIGTALVEHAITFAEENGYKLIPLCPFVAAYLRKHPEFHHLIVGQRGKEAAEKRKGSTQ